MVPAGPVVGDKLVTDSTIHVVDKYSVGVDAVGAVTPHALTFNVVEEQDGVGIGTKYREKNIYDVVNLDWLFYLMEYNRVVVQCRWALVNTMIAYR